MWCCSEGKPFLFAVCPWLVCDTQEVKSWHDYYDYCDDNDELVEWYEGYKGRKTQKAKIEEELMPIAWNTSRWCDWCVPEDEKREREKNYGCRALDHDILFCVRRQDTKFFWPKITANKHSPSPSSSCSSSLLNVSNDASSKSEEFRLKDIEVFVDSREQNWFKKAHLGTFLGIEDIRTSLNGLEKCAMPARNTVKAAVDNPYPWSGSRD